MVEQNTARAKDVVALSVVDGHPVRIELGHAVRAAGVERRAFNLGNGLHLAKHLGRTGLVEADLGVDQANGFKHVEAANAGDLRGGAGLVKRHAHKALSSQVVDFVGLHLLHQRNAGTQVGQVIFNQMQIGVLLDAQLFNAPKVDGAGAAVGAVNGVAFFEQKLRQVSAVLACDAGEDGGFHVNDPRFFINYRYAEHASIAVHSASNSAMACPLSEDAARQHAKTANHQSRQKDRLLLYPKNNVRDCLQLHGKQANHGR